MLAACWLLPAGLLAQEAPAPLRADSLGTPETEPAARPEQSAAAGRTRRLQSEWSGQIALEGAWFYDAAYFPDQRDSYASLVAQPKYILTAAQAGLKLTVRPFVRLDAVDASRTHADVRELYASWSHHAWEVNAGVQSVAWGNMLGPSLVNILNQTDEREDFTKFERLGQPLLDVAHVGETSSLRLYVAPGFRPKAFPGVRSRLFYFPLPIATDQQTIEHENRPALAARYTQRAGNFDLALSHFYGTNRAPVMHFDRQRFLLVPVYRTIHQTGLETQWIRGNLTTKAEFTYRADGKNYLSYNAGLEYLFANLSGHNLDVLLAAEYLRDPWKKDNQYPFADMFFTAARLTLGGLHTSELAIHLLTNRASWTPLLNVEAKRHFAEHWQATLGWTSYVGPALVATDALSVIQYNSAVQLGLRRYW
ncbi:hypothetical protein D0T11_12240 [Hymenobacter rubripertinctus]|uniref:Alginate export domain-containing protein n=1 Tax=Hymenobacter rubripertinctus TaxID=2029981 RepID=A0A418QWN4_9BACT|nr:hypothetical protein D0T11_12240 [Hymenobacter rubripertinctus]